MNTVTGGGFSGLHRIRQVLERLESTTKWDDDFTLQPEIDELLACAEHMRVAIQRIERSGMVEGEQHKQWVIDQVLRLLLAEGYQDWITQYNAYPNYEDWDVGIAP